MNFFVFALNVEFLLDLESLGLEFDEILADPAIRLRVIRIVLS
jgi:hypothetical protein